MTDRTEIIAQIRAWHRQRCFAMEQRKRNTLALGAFIRVTLGWTKDAPEAERKRIAQNAAHLIKDGGDGEWARVIEAAKLSVAPFIEIEKRALKEMTKLARSLPVWESFGADIRGFGAASLAVILAEAGDLSNYATVAKLWKRMGLAVMGGVRQGGLTASAPAASWIAHGYNRKRRSHIWNIGDSLIKGNKGAYRAVYIERKAYEIARDPQIKPIKAHRRAQRYMEKRLLRNLWDAWRRAAVPQLQPFEAVPLDLSSAAEAKRHVRAIAQSLPPVPSFPRGQSHSAPEAERPAFGPLSSDTTMPGAISEPRSHAEIPIERKAEDAVAYMRF